MITPAGNVSEGSLLQKLEEICGRSLEYLTHPYPGREHVFLKKDPWKGHGHLGPECDWSSSISRILKLMGADVAHSLDSSVVFMAWLIILEQ